MVRSCRWGWWVLLAAVLEQAAPARAVTITEINYFPPAGGPNLQFVEVMNEAATAADLSGWYFSQGIQFTFPEGTILGGRSYLAICADQAAVAARYSITNVLGNFAGSLDPQGETVEISNSSGVPAVTVSYKARAKCPSAPRGTGHTLSLRSTYLDPDAGVGWAASLEMGGTPGKANFPAQGAEEVDIVRNNAPWKYLKGTAEFSSPPGAWRTEAFDHNAWLNGTTGIGYGGGDD